MDNGLNHVSLIGTLERNPSTRFTADHGLQQVSFTLRLTEAGPAGQPLTLLVPCQCYAEVAEDAGELSAGHMVLVAGRLQRLAWTDPSGQKKSTLCVLGRLVKRLAPAAVKAST